MGRAGHSACVIADDRIAVFGGSDSLQMQWFNDLFIFDVERMLWVRAAVSGGLPLARHGHIGVGLDDGRMFVFGGSYFQKPLGDAHWFDYGRAIDRATRIRL